jgi:hypothetical protein
MYKDRTEQRKVTETMNSLLAPMLNHLNNDTAIIVKRALYLLKEIKIEPQEISDRNLKMWHDIYEEEKRRTERSNE